MRPNLLVGLRIGFKAGLFFFLLMANAQAEFFLSPRYEYIRGKSEMANRLQLKSKLNSSYENFSFFTEAFGEVDAAPVAKENGGRADHVFLQELYLEYKWQSFYLRVGRQAMRWSESWSLPSLDIWTGRKFNRLFFDEFADQLNHSTGVLASYAAEKVSLDLVGVTDPAETQLPAGYPLSVTKKKKAWGARAKWAMGDFGFSALGGRFDEGEKEKNSAGLSVNYAFEKAVPKLEYGTLEERTVFTTLGCDFFLGNWILLPQVTFSEGDSTYYTSLQWSPDRHELQAQVFYNAQTKDSFASLSYGYNWTDDFSTTAFVQNYEGFQAGFYSGIRVGYAVPF